MLFSNVDLKQETREMPFGNLTGVSIGEQGRGRREIFLPTPYEFCELKANALFSDFTIGQSKSGRPRIDKKQDNEIYLILSSQRGYTRRGCGFIQYFAGAADEGSNIANKLDAPQIIARGNGADGDAGRIGSWDVLIIKAREGDCFRVVWGGSGYGYPSTIYCVRNGKIIFADTPDIEIAMDDDTPFNLTYEEGRTLIYAEEWIKL